MLFSFGGSSKFAVGILHFSNPWTDCPKRSNMVEMTGFSCVDHIKSFVYPQYCNVKLVDGIGSLND